MSATSVTTRGYGFGGYIGFVVTRGYALGIGPQHSILRMERENLHLVLEGEDRHLRMRKEPKGNK
jgi:hypothetical protein